MRWVFILQFPSQYTSIAYFSDGCIRLRHWSHLLCCALDEQLHKRTLPKLGFWLPHFLLECHSVSDVLLLKGTFDESFWNNWRKICRTSSTTYPRLLKIILKTTKSGGHLNVFFVLIIRLLYVKWLGWLQSNTMWFRFLFFYLTILYMHSF